MSVEYWNCGSDHRAVDRGSDTALVALMLGEENIREVIAFPKTATAYDPMTEAPSGVTEKQLKEPHIKLPEGAVSDIRTV